jgi:hypothetical protein
MEAVVELFWVRHASGEGEGESYSRPEPKKTLMLHYIFVTALLLEDWQMAPAQVGASHPGLCTAQTIGRGDLEVEQ